MRTLIPLKDKVAGCVVDGGLIGDGGDDEGFVGPSSRRARDEQGS